MSRPLRRAVKAGVALLVAGSVVEGLDWFAGECVVILLCGVLIGYVLWRVPYQEHDSIDDFAAMRHALDPDEH